MTAAPGPGPRRTLLGMPRVRETASPVLADPAFDALRPPDPDLLDDCVHCGFCLTTCPTYQLWGEEMDSPRGRIDQIRSAAEGAPLTAATVGHLDACLGCMACVTSCPSGVRYDRLLEQTRAQVERRVTRPRRDRALRALIFALFPTPTGCACCAARCGPPSARARSAWCAGPGWWDGSAPSWRSCSPWLPRSGPGSPCPGAPRRRGPAARWWGC
ncbi:4Fe-4S dicluster domain-containing protein [Serinicoccus chungangensis]|uniref:4Fe-4S dicluster domain-containing protein n=1 Tax=Serinicoccus chungangensis TaxID=767452 RepID=UPI001EE7D338|nr:4Fe-4S dicluster domain-containing protein [Serinicoccus chungangensis]